MIAQPEDDKKGHQELPDLIVTKEQINQFLDSFHKGATSSEELVSYIFGSRNGYEKAKRQYSQLPQPLCAKAIPENSLTYKCYDCGRNNDYHIYCEECFQPETHVGHRFLRSLQRYGCCDCGDANAIDPQGFCKKHRGFQGLGNLAGELQSEVRSRLEHVVVGLFDKVFWLCEEMNIQGEFNTNSADERICEILAVEISTALGVISTFVESYCKDMLPMLFEICNILSLPRAMKRRHVCGKNSYKEMFLADQMNPPVHECSASITDFIYMHSMMMRGDKELLTNILYTLFMNPTYKVFLVEKYVERYKFLLGRHQNGEFQESELKTMYTQFFSEEQIKTFLNSKYLERPIEMITDFYEGMRTANYENDMKGVIGCYGMLDYMTVRIQNLGLQLEGFNILNTMLKLSFVSVLDDNDITVHQKYRLFVDNILLEQFCKLLGSLSYANKEAKELLGGLVILYFTQAEKHDYEKKLYPFMWHTQPQRMLGLVLMLYVVQYGVQEARILVDKCLSPKVYEKVMSKLLRLYDWEENLMQSKYVGFLGEETPKDLLKYYYRTPQTLLYESNQLCLQMLACTVNPELFIKFYLQNLLPHHQVDHLVQLLLEESYAVDSASCCKQAASPMIAGVKKLYLINALNFQRKQTYDSIEKLFDKSIFNMSRVKLEEALSAVADFDRETSIYTLRREFEGYTERQLFVRNAEYYSRMSDKMGDLKASEFGKQRLLEYQVQQNIPSVCRMVTENLCNSVVFLSNIVCKFYRELSDDIPPEQYIKHQKEYFMKLKVIQACLVRCGHNQSLREFMASESERSKPATSQIQQVLLDLAKSFNLSRKSDIEVEKQTNAPVAKSDKAALRKKQLLEQMKNKSNKFIQKNTALTVPEAEPTAQKAVSLCLICHEKKTGDMVIPFRRIAQQTLPDKTYQSFSSCFHTFHMECLVNLGIDWCALCRTPFPLILAEIRSPLSFYSLRGKEKESFYEAAPEAEESRQVSTFLNMVSLQLEEQGQQMVLSFKLFEQMIVSKIQLCISMTGYYFGEKMLPVLKSLTNVYAAVSRLTGEPFRESCSRRLEETIEMPPKEFVSRIAQRKVQTFVQLIELLLQICLLNNSKDTILLYRKVVGKYFNAFLAVNLVSSGAVFMHDTLVSELLKSYKETTYSQMTEFCRGILELYSLVFEESFQKELEEMDKDIAAVVTVVDRCSDIFEVDFKLLEQYLQCNRQATQKIPFSQESLLIRAKLIDLPDNYLEFHHKYYNKMCEKCKAYPRVKGVVGYMCLLCGRRACEINCTGDGSQVLEVSDHNLKHHCRMGAFMDLDTGMSYIIEQAVALTYGYLYMNQFDVSNNETEKDWTKLLLDRSKITRILSLLHKQSLLEQIIAKIGSNKQKALRA